MITYPGVTITTPAPQMTESDALILADQITEWLRERIEETHEHPLRDGYQRRNRLRSRGGTRRAKGGDRAPASSCASSIPDDAGGAKGIDAFGIKVANHRPYWCCGCCLRRHAERRDVVREHLQEQIYWWRCPPPVGARQCPSSITDDHQLLSGESQPGIVVGTWKQDRVHDRLLHQVWRRWRGSLPLLDLYKFEVRAVAKAIGVPETVVITRPPSALDSGLVQTTKTRSGVYI